MINFTNCCAEQSMKKNDREHCFKLMIDFQETINYVSNKMIGFDKELYKN